ncbi:MAG TPA: RNA-binding protein [Planctomycetota bacterium]|nr:RNA-binding protein [Planctomycetota bacterium]
MNIYVGNLPFSVTDDQLRAAFEPFGDVSSAQVVQDRETGRSRGFGFIEMPSDEQGRAAIQGLDGTDLAGRSLKVNEARPKTDRREGGGGGGGYRGGSGGGGGRRPSW